MTSSSLSDQFVALHEALHLSHIDPARCTHGVITQELDHLAALGSGMLRSHEAGRSLQGRRIPQVEFGDGPARILLWTQMHGDEPTATLALLDLLRILVAECNAEWVTKLLHDVTVSCIVMLNPDGAELCQRQNAVQIDLNRDALAMASPEALILRNAHTEFQPGFAFNLHDQSLSSVGETARAAALALLAPPFDRDRTINNTRMRAMRIGALIRRTLGAYAEGAMTRYADDFEPRAFGDGMQLWGTSALLIESGHWPGDPEKRFVRKLNCVALLSAMCGIGDGTYEQVPLELYFDLPPNGKRCFDILLTDVVATHASGWTRTVSVGLNYAPRTSTNRAAWPESVVVKDVGDLSMYGGLRVIDAENHPLSTESIALERIIPLPEFFDILGIEGERLRR